MKNEKKNENITILEVIKQISTTEVVCSLFNMQFIEMAPPLRNFCI